LFKELSDSFREESSFSFILGVVNVSFWEEPAGFVFSGEGGGGLENCGFFV